MKTKTLKMLVAIGLLAIFALPASNVLADSPAAAQLSLVASSQGTIGQDLVLRAKASNATGGPVAGVEVTFKASATFLNNESEIEIGRAVTDKTGVASLEYVPRTQGDLNVSAVLSGAVPAVKSSAAVVKVSDGPEQHESEKTGVHVPGLGPWFLALIMGFIWLVFLWAIMQVRHIFRQGQPPAARQVPGTSGLEHRHV